MSGNAVPFSLDTKPGDHSLAQALDKFDKWEAGEAVRSTGRRVGSLLVPDIRLGMLADELPQHNDTIYGDELRRRQTRRSQLIAPIFDGFMNAARAYWQRCGLPERSEVYTDVDAGTYKGKVQRWHCDYQPQYKDETPELAITCSFGAGATMTTSGQIDRSQIGQDGMLRDQNAVGGGKPLLVVKHRVGDLVAFLNAGDIHRSPPMPTQKPDQWRLFLRASIYLR